MDKGFGKHKEFKLLNKYSEQKETYVRYFYECECKKCGEYRLLSQSDANTGVCLNCKKQKTIDNIIGKVINNYKIIKFSHKNRIHNYECECISCGTKSVVSIAGIKSNKNCKNCRVYGKEPTEEAQLKYRKDQYLQGAKQRSLNFYLSDKEFENLIFGNCYYCKDKPEERKYSNSRNKTKTFSYNGIDRIDSNIGYTKENCVTCCEMCNRMKMAYSKEEFLKKIEKIYNNLLKK